MIPQIYSNAENGASNARGIHQQWETMHYNGNSIETLNDLHF